MQQHTRCTYSFMDASVTRRPVFVVGAGFSLAANTRYPLHPSIARPYPLASDLALACFPNSSLEVGIEAAFDEAIKRHDFDPVRRLVDVIQMADASFGAAKATAPASPYGLLLDRFPDTQFISFNYDALLELLLLKRGLWNPLDGFGVPAEIEKANDQEGGPSKTLVIHLHGSTLLYSVRFEVQRESGSRWPVIQPREEPRFVFDPDALAAFFLPFERGLPGLAYQHPEFRIIAPIPDKREAMTGGYTKLAYRRAVDLIRVASDVVAIGYRFADCDRVSFQPLLAAAAAASIPVWVVDPEAVDIAGRLATSREHVRAEPIPMTFQQWVGHGFPGPGHP